jgi:hypothetical protein
MPDDTVASASLDTPGDEDPALVATAPKGHIIVGQFKLVIPIKGTGAKVPISVTASNRTELIKEKDVRASIGFTLDLDTIVGLLTSR